MELELHQLDLRYQRLRVRRPEQERRLLASLAEQGQQVPLGVVAMAGDPNRFLVIDGYKRIRALQRLGQDTVRATVWNLDEVEALLLDRSMRTAPGETPLEQGWLLAELQGSFGHSLEEMARRFDRSVSWVSRRLALVQELPDSVQEQVRRGQVPAHAAMKYLVPMARAHRADCLRLAEAIAQYQFTNAQVAELYAAWREGRPALRERLLEEPELFLRARRELQEPPVALPGTEALLRDLELMAALARRAQKQWRQIATPVDPEERANLSRCLQQARADLDRLSQDIHKENTDVDCQPTDDHLGASSERSSQAPDCQHPGSVPPDRQESHPLPIGTGSQDRASGESRALPPTDPGALHRLSWQSGPSP